MNRQRGKPPRMKWYIKAFIVVAVATLVAYIGGMIYLVKAKYAMNEYVLQLGAAFNAATMVNATETHTEPENAVIAAYGNEKSVIVPENYKMLQSYLRMDYAAPPLAFVDKEEALHVSICGESALYIEGDKDGQGAMIRFESAGEHYTMHVAGGDLWQKILSVCLDGSYKAENIPA